jgi:hypothetical protein
MTTDEGLDDGGIDDGGIDKVHVPVKKKGSRKR